jgi:hypothetical protein
MFKVKAVKHDHNYISDVSIITDYKVKYFALKRKYQKSKKRIKHLPTCLERKKKIASFPCLMKHLNKKVIITENTTNILRVDLEGTNFRRDPCNSKFW